MVCTARVAKKSLPVMEGNPIQTGNGYLIHSFPKVAILFNFNYTT